MFGLQSPYFLPNPCHRLAVLRASGRYPMQDRLFHAHWPRAPNVTAALCHQKKVRRDHSRLMSSAFVSCHLSYPTRFNPSGSEFIALLISNACSTQFATCALVWRNLLACRCAYRWLDWLLEWPNCACTSYKVPPLDTINAATE